MHGKVGRGASTGHHREGDVAGSPAVGKVTLVEQIVRGYVQQFRVNTDLPEPLAKLHEVKAGDTVEKLAVQEYSSSVRDGHDLRYYENVLLYANKQRGRIGITGTYQDPGLLGGGANNVQLVAGHRIWLVSPTYAHALEGVVPDGSLTNGTYAKVKRFVQHVVDIIQSITQSPHYFGEIAGEYAQAIGEASREFLRMLVSIAMAALSYVGMKGNLGKAVKIAQSMPPVGMVPAFAGTGRGGSMVGTGEAVNLGGPGRAGPLGTSAAMMTKHGEGEGGGGSEKPEPKPAADEPAKLDEASFTSNAKPPELVTAKRVAARPEFKGRTFRAPPPPDPGFDWVDDLGRTFDAMGDGTTSKYFKFKSFKAAIDHHLLKGNTFTVIDMTGYTADQIAEVRAYVDTLPAGHIIRVGF